MCREVRGEVGGSGVRFRDSDAGLSPREMEEQTCRRGDGLMGAGRGCVMRGSRREGGER